MLLDRKYHPDKWDINILEFSLDKSVEKFKNLSNTYDELKQYNILFWISEKI